MPYLASVLALAGLAQAPAPAPPVKLPEGLRMFGSILANGAEMGPGTGWFGPAASRHGWSWLADRADANRDGKVTPDEWKAAPGLFERLDRDADGAVTAADLDWSPASPYLQRQMMVRQRFASLDDDGNGRISQEEFRKLYAAVARDDSGLTPEDLGVLFGLTARRGAGGAPPRGGPPPAAARPSLGAILKDLLPPSGAPDPAAMPSRHALLKGLVSGEIGALREGPAVGDRAPDFALPLADSGADDAGKPVETTVRLSDLLGEQPVILIFGSFT
jgi:hypothetical protein